MHLIHVFALKRLFWRDVRTDHAKETRFFRQLSVKQHPHIENPVFINVRVGDSRVPIDSRRAKRQQVLSTGKVCF